MDMVLDEAKRKVRSWLKGWKVRDGVPKGLDAWQEVRLMSAHRFKRHLTDRDSRRFLLPIGTR